MMEHASVELPAFHVVGIAKRVSNDDPTAIGEHWQRFMSKPFRAQLDAADEAVYSVYFDYEADYMKPYTLLLGYRVSDGAVKPAGLDEVAVPGARYVRLSRSGPMPVTVVEAWKEVWAADLNRAYRADFDRHPSPDTVEVHVGIL